MERNLCNLMNFEFLKLEAVVTQNFAHELFTPHCIAMNSIQHSSLLSLFVISSHGSAVSVGCRSDDGGSVSRTRERLHRTVTGASQSSTRRRIAAVGVAADQRCVYTSAQEDRHHWIVFHLRRSTAHCSTYRRSCCRTRTWS